MLQGLLVLALAASPEADLLSIASIQEMDQAKCPDALESYRKFFDTCHACELGEYGTSRFEGAVARCGVEPRAVGAYASLFAPHTTPRELAGLLRRAWTIDATETRHLYLRSVPAIAAGDRTQMNQLRRATYAIIERVAPTSSEMIALADRIRMVEGSEARAIENALAAPGTLSDPDALSKLRRRAIELLDQHSGMTAQVDPSQCQVTNEFGYVTISARPWGKVFINGEPAGETPISRKKVPAGCAEIRVVSGQGNNEKTANVVVRPNIVQIFTFDLEKN
jgi:hypothetical protein